MGCNCTTLMQEPELASAEPEASCRLFQGELDVYSPSDSEPFPLMTLPLEATESLSASPFFQLDDVPADLSSISYYSDQKRSRIR